MKPNFQNQKCLLHSVARFTAVALFVSMLHANADGNGKPTDPAVDRSISLDFSPSLVQRELSRIALATGERRKFACPQASDAPKIDGVLDDACWQKAHVFRGLIDPARGPKTIAYVTFDSGNLYIGVDCTKAPGVEPKATLYPQNNGTPWREDCIEVFVTVDNDSGAVDYQFVVNAAGSMFGISSDSWFGRDSSSYDGKWLAAAKNEGEHWFVEIAIPTKAVGLKQWPSNLLFNIGRNGPPPFALQALGSVYGKTGLEELVLDGIRPKRTLGESKTAAATSSRGKILSGTGLKLTMERPFARPGERWIEGQIALSSKESLGQTRVRAELFSLAGGSPLASKEVKPETTDGPISVDLRSHGLAEGELVVRLIERGKETSVSRALLSAQPPVEPLAIGQRIPLTVDSAKETGRLKDWPVMIGIPFPAGALWDTAPLRVVDDKGKEIPSQFEVTGRWSRDGAIKWVRLNTTVSSDRSYFVETGGTPVGRALPALAKQEGSDRIILDTGVSKFVVAKGISPIREIWMGNVRVATSDGTRGMYVVDQKGRLASAVAAEETLQLECSGPQAASVRLEGLYKTKDGQTLAGHVTRIEVFAGQPFAKVTHSFVITRDSNEVWFKEIGWELATTCGSDPRAIFGVDRDKPAEQIAQPLGGNVKSAYMFQDSHFQFRTNVNHFSVSTTDASGIAAKVREGAECGDWATLAGDKAALLIGCRESARQHPKEFELSSDRAALRLFSNRGGDELDFRTSALAKLWNLKEWLKQTEMIIVQYKGQTLEKGYVDSLKLPSNAQGWAKTHEIVLAPLPASDAPTASPSIAGTLAFPMYVHVDPKWIYQTGALGPLHPKDADRFPEAEETLQKVFEDWDRRDSEMGLFGFLSFESGPYPFKARGDRRWGEAHRWPITYNVQRDLLLLAARSGDRAIRARAEATNRTAVDNKITHWDSEGRVRGGWILVTGADDVVACHSGFPFFWQGITCFDTAGTSIPENLMTLHYLTGDRRAGEVTGRYFQALKAGWKPQEMRRQFFPLRYFTMFPLGYEFTGDPEFAEIARHHLDLLFDPESLLLVGQFAYSPSYKVQQDLHGLIRSYEALGDERLRQWIVTRASYLFDSEIPYLNRYQSAQGDTASFLYRETKEPAVAENTAMLIRQLGTFYDPEKKQILDLRGIPLNGARVGVIMNGLFFGQDAVVRSDADRKTLASWAGASFWDNEIGEKPGVAGSIIVEKAANRPLVIRYQGSSQMSKGEVRMRRMEGKEGEWATDLNTSTTWIDGYQSRISIEKFAPPGPYEIIGGQIQFCMANEKRRMVLYAPADWTPFPNQRPSVPIYFNLPENAKDPLIWFEGSAQLFDPEGKPFPKDEPVTGEVKLPADRTGLWSFKPVVNKKTRVKNLPPYFAFRDPMLYFTPPTVVTNAPMVGAAAR